jgi:FkbM family methyltransferase
VKNIINTIKKNFAAIRLLRFVFLKALKLFSCDIKIKNPYTCDELIVNIYRHKTYWFYGKSRERETMEMFANVIKKNDVVFEIGGHIGFITQHFSKLVGNTGVVIVFEPGKNNIPYIEKNIFGKLNVFLEKVAVSNQVGEALFYEDNISGQNNSLLPDYKGAVDVAKTHFERLRKEQHVVSITTIDQYIKTTGSKCDYIKIDIEGNELKALQGAKNALRLARGIMIEVTENQSKVSQLLLEAGFALETESGVELNSIPSGFHGNVFGRKRTPVHMVPKVC